MFTTAQSFVFVNRKATHRDGRKATRPLELDDWKGSEPETSYLGQSWLGLESMIFSIQNMWLALSL